jgi:uncharacterized protein YqkB
MKKLPMVENKTCFYEHEKRNLSCHKSNCRYWINCKKYNNCALLASKAGPLTLQEIGDIFSVTRMRICQIEKSILDKVSQSFCKD